MTGRVFEMAKRLATAVSLAALVAVLLPGSAMAVPKDFYGLVAGGAADQTDYKQMKKAHVGAVRFTVNWPQVQPNPNGPFNFERADALVGSLAAQGIRPVVTVFGSPKWVESKPYQAPVDSSKAKKAWRNFLTAIVNRYKAGGAFWSAGGAYHAQFGAAARPKPVKAWQIWNEPNLSKYFAPHKNAVKKYAALVKLSHGAIAKADAKAQVVLAGPSGGENGKPTPPKFMTQLYRVKGIKHAFDVAALHPYPPTVKDLQRSVKQFRAAMRKGHDAKTQLWLTELGWGSARPGRNTPLNKGLKGQAKVLKDSFKLLRAKRKAWKIGGIYWYTWRDPPTTGNHPVCTFCTSAGLLKNNRTRKPAYKAYVRFTGGS
jgi:GH35 family endo-1,4-beta-xylanase